MTDDWEGHPDVPVSDAELSRLIAEDAGFGRNPLAALHDPERGTR